VSKYKVKRGQYFDRDIDRICAFLYANDYPESVILNCLENLYTSMALLGEHPRAGASLSNKTTIPNNYRYLVSGQYLLFYKVFDAEKTVKVYHVFHSKENYLIKLGL